MFDSVAARALLVVVFVLGLIAFFGTAVYNDGCGPTGPALHDSSCNRIDIHGNRY